MKFLYIIWTGVRNIFEGAVWATLIWTASEPFYPLRWLLWFWFFFTVLTIIGFKAVTVEPWLARSMLVIDPMLVGLAILQAAINALVLTVVTLVIAALIHVHTDWLHVFLFFGSGLYILWRRNGKRKAVRSWQGTKVQWEPSDLLTEATPIKHLPAWQQERLQEHRLQRSSLNAQPGELVWTRGSNGVLVTELDLYWSDVALLKNGRIGFTVYSKKSGVVANDCLDCQSEQEAMDRALDWMRHGRNSDEIQRP
jgi:hypothetical protein